MFNWFKKKSRVHEEAGCKCKCHKGGSWTRHYCCEVNKKRPSHEEAAKGFAIDQNNIGEVITNTKRELEKAGVDLSRKPYLVIPVEEALGEEAAKEQAPARVTALPGPAFGREAVGSEPKDERPDVRLLLELLRVYSSPADKQRLYQDLLAIASAHPTRSTHTPPRPASPSKQKPSRQMDSLQGKPPLKEGYRYEQHPDGRVVDKGPSPVHTRQTETETSVDSSEIGISDERLYLEALYGKECWALKHREEARLMKKVRLASLDNHKADQSHP